MTSLKFRRAAGLSAVALVAVSSFAAYQYSGTTPPPKDLKGGFDSVSVADCKQWLGYLAGPECEGRGTGQPGFQKAAEYMAARFKEYGFKPAGDNGTYFQNVPFFRSRIAPETAFAVNGIKVGMKGNFTVNASRDSVVEADVVLLAPANNDAKLEDPASLKDKIVFITNEGARELRSQVRGAGAAAFFTVTKNPIGEPGWSVRRTRPTGNGGQGGGTVSGTITQGALERLAGMVDMNATLTATEGVAIARGSRKVELTLRTQSEDVMVPNVVGVLPGTDPNLKNEVVGLGSHLDHLGNQGGTIYWGADDDGSGSTALLAVAKAFHKNKVKPKRSVLLMAFCGEEMGLIGSAFYAEKPLFPPDNWVCELQMDMVGRNEQKADEKAEDNINTIHLVGSKRISTDLHNLVLEMNKHVGFVFEYDEEGVYTRSDHYMFAAKGIPISFIFSGFHPDYHQPTDTIEKINFEKIANTARLYYLVAASAANAPQKLRRQVIPSGG